MAYQRTKLEYKRIRDAIEDAVAGSLTAHKPGVKQNLQVLRNIRLTCIQAVRDLVDGDWAALQRLQDAEAARLSQDLKPSSHQLYGLLVKHHLQLFEY